MKLYNIPTLSTFDPPVSPLAKVTGGEVSTPGEFPHYVGLYSPQSGEISCGGAILSAYLILTAAHCIHGERPSDYRVIAGEHNRKKHVGSEQTRLIKEFYMHENYTLSESGGVNNDIALIVLNAPFVFTDEVKNISLPRANEEFTGTVKIMGFGETRSSYQRVGRLLVGSTGADPDEFLLKVQVPIVSYEECAANYSTIEKYVTPEMFCAGLPGKDACNRDSGGPTLCKRANEKEPILCGIVSWGEGCGWEGFPGVNTKVSRYIDWIQNAAKVLADRRKCQTHEFSCSGSCIPRTKICDGTVDCYRGLDEMGCHNSNKTECEPDQLRCDNGNCVKRQYFCDGNNDCKDNSDELKCPSPGWTCNNETEVKCGHTGRCIPKEWKCDGRFDCDDLSDENETCGNFNSTAFQIHSTTATVTPPDGSCPYHEFYCPNPFIHGNCAPLHWRCDGFRHCSGGIDEANCSSTSANGRETSCPSSHKFYCPHPLVSDYCASRSLLCDGVRDCLDGRDEANCSYVRNKAAPSLPAGQCPPEKFYCPGSRFKDNCAPLTLECDDVTDCAGGIDEEGCPPASERCPVGGFFCPGNRHLVTNCAPIRWRCDGARDCRRGVDEENCTSGGVTTTTTTSRPTTTTRNPSTSQCELNEFYCLNNLYRKCIPLRYRCDGDDDCTGGDDEKDCNNEVEEDVVTARPRAISMTTTTKAPLQCASSEFKCADGSKCVPTSFKCDGDRDCSDGSDEASCSTASYEGHVSISRTPCPSNKFECPVGGTLRVCVPLNVSWKCDGDANCPEGYLGRYSSPLAKISGGEVSTPGEFPHHVGLYWSHSHGVRCGGAILSAYLILTAAHCINGRNPRDLRVIAGEHNRKKRVGSEQARLIKEFYMHENYTDSGSINDIALIVLNAPLVFTDEVKNISLPRANEEFTGTVEIMGFGRTFESGPHSSVLLKVQVPIISYEECAANYSTIDAYVTRDMFCAGLPGKEACKGDSGGSTLCKRANDKEPILCGIVSWGKDCDLESFPGVNTKVSRYIDWIQNAVKVLADRRKCQTHEFSCSGSCIPRTKICDGTVDCYRGLDEMGCHNSNKTQCEPGQLRCDNGNCVKRKYFCDDDNDCQDNSDELKCPNPDWTCNDETEVKCGHTGRCIPKEWKCDGRFDCDDLSDENETCGNFNSTAFQIHSATTTMKPLEANTTGTGSASCPPHEFYCLSTVLHDNCAPLRWQCDGYVDCYGGLDEIGCNNSNEKQCKPDQLQCDNGICLKRKYFCDGDNDCQDNSDELKCPTPHWPCNEETEVKCGHTGRCIPKEWKCDGHFDCDDLSDENETCANFNSTAFQIHSATTTVKPPEANTKATGSGSCPSHEFYCLHPVLHDNCAPLRWRCDGDRDCLGGIDEANCSSTSANGGESSCPSHKFYCPHPLLPDNCASRSWLCDGDRNCLDGRDEANCSFVPTTAASSLPAGQCPQGKFYCPDSRFSDSCAPLRWKCDDETDCTGGSDEEGCPPASERCPAGRFFCPGNPHLTSNCAELWWRCDGDRDCRGGIDEKNCRSGGVTTTTTTSRPTTTTRNPSTSQCEVDEFHCPNNLYRKCIPVRYRCDGDDDCTGGDDEKDCNNEVEVDVVTARPRAIPMSTTTKAPIQCTVLEFKCADGSKCVLAMFKCDGDRDCSDGSDEASCSTASNGNIINRER